MSLICPPCTARRAAGRTVLPRLASALAIVVALGSASASAQPVAGTLTFTGEARFAPTFAHFLCTVPGGPPCPPNDGNIVVGPAAQQSVDFVPLAGAFGVARSLDFQHTQPVGAIFGFPNAVTFVAPDIALDFSMIPFGSAAQCPGVGPLPDPCTPVVPALASPADPLGLAPYVLGGTPNGSTLSFTVFGFARRVATGDLSPIVGTYTATFTNTPGTTDADLASLVARLEAEATKGGVLAPYTAVFSTPVPAVVPEPSVPALLASGLITLGGLGLRRRRRAR